MITEFIQSQVPGPYTKGQIFEFAWFVFRVRDAGPPLVLEGLDLVSKHGYTTDLSEAERIHQLQAAMLKAHEAEAEPCTLYQSAIVSLSYSPDRPDAYMRRETAVEGHSSGWYLGVLDETLDMNDKNSFKLMSLYDISIQDRRTLPYWLMPIGTEMQLHDAHSAYTGSGKSGA